MTAESVFMALVGPVAGGLAGAGGMGGLWLFLTARAKARASVEVAETEAAPAMVAAAAEFQSNLNAIAQGMLAGLQTQVNTLQGQAAALQHEIDALKAENVECRSENRQMIQRIDSLEAELRRRGIDLPTSRALAGTFVVMEGDHTTVLAPVHHSEEAK